MFKPTKVFMEQYDLLFKDDPVQANLFLLIAELADEQGKVVFEGDDDEVEQQLTVLMNARFNDQKKYAFDGGGKNG